VHHSEVSNEFYIPLEDVTGNKHKAYVKYDKWEETVTLYRTVVPTVFEGKPNVL
jgi:predicted GNAT family acetyltransferase